MSLRDRMRPAPGTAGLSFCETIAAIGSSPWHIRKLSPAGPKYTGGADSPTLCGKTMRFGGWDVNVPMTTEHMAHACKSCRDAWAAGQPKEGGGK